MGTAAVATTAAVDAALVRQIEMGLIKSLLRRLAIIVLLILTLVGYQWYINRQKR